MLLSGDTFPNRPISSDEKLLVMQNCGGPPVNQLEPVRNFMTIAGIPLLQHYPVWQLIKNVRVETVDALDVRTSQSELAFNRGAFLYAGLLHDLSDLHALPAENRVVTEIVDRYDTGAFDLGLDLLSKAQAIPGIDGFLEDFRGVMIGDDKRDYTAAMLGVGAVHYLLTESQSEIQTASSLDANFPELEGLFDGFGDLPPID